MGPAGGVAQAHGGHAAGRGGLIAPPTPLQALWLERMRRDLPAAAKAHPEWPVHDDHCFGRIILDTVCGRPWRKAIAAPAWRHLSADQMTQAIALADAILTGKVDVQALNRASLELRRGSRLQPRGWPPSGLVK